MYQWRQRGPVRQQSCHAADFLIPCQPSLSAVAPSESDWMHELKHDGWRLLARVDGSEVRLWTREGRDVTNWFTGIARAVASLPIPDVVLDGEAVVFLPNGHSAFHRLRSAGWAAGATMVAFDLLHFDGADLRNEPLEHRRRLLQELIAEHPGIMFSREIEGDGPAAFEFACAIGAEGIVSKRRDSTYQSGRVDTWRKTKFAGFQRR